MTIIYGTQGTIEVNGERIADVGAWEADVVDEPPIEYLHVPRRVYTFTISQSDWQRQQAIEAWHAFHAWLVRTRFRRLPYRIMRRKLARLR